LILKHESDNPKFNFLKNEDDPYRPYYLKKLKEGADQAKEEVLEVSDLRDDYQSMLRKELFGDSKLKAAQKAHKAPPSD
jgi:hypothetical protein